MAPQDSDEPTPVLDDGGAAPAPARAPAPHAAELDPVDAGRYDLGAEVARGGIGRIVRARDKRLGRAVAVKQLLSGGRGAARFAREALITARLQHPSIVPVYDAGRWPSGEPFYSMKLLAGRSLEQAIAAAAGFRERIALLPSVIAVADAIAYAHSQKVIHRDLKPANVIVGEFGETVVVDWGMARLLGEGSEVVDGEDAAADSLASAEQLTRAGAVVGTPAYMPPEQAAGAGADERSDVYALGAMLYHLLAGVPPYRGPGAAAVLAALEGGPPRPLAEREPAVPGELAAIVAKAMARAPADRYPTAGALAEDLRRFQTGQLVGAHAYSAWQLLARWLRRHRAAVSVAALLLTALAVTGVLSFQRVVRARRHAEQQTVIAVEQRAAADQQRTRAEERSNEQRLLQARAALASDPTAALAWLKSWSPRPGGLPEALAIAADAEARGVALHLLAPRGESIQDAEFDPQGRWLAAPVEHTVHLWKAARGDDVALAAVDARLQYLALDGRGEWLAAHDDTGGVWAWSLAGEVAAAAPIALGRVARPGPGHPVVFLDDGRLATLDGQGVVRVWDLRSPAHAVAERQTDGSRLLALAGGAVAHDRGDGGVAIWVPGGEARVLAGAGVPLLELQAAPGGERLAAVDEDGAIRVLELAGGRWRTLGRARTFAPALALSPDGRWLAVTGVDPSTVEVWALAGGAPRVLRGHADSVTLLRYAPDGARLASAALDGEVRLWDLDTGSALVLRGHTQQVEGLSFAPDGAWLASSAADGARVWRVESRGGRRLGDAGVIDLAFAPDGARLAAAGMDGVVRWWAGDGGAGGSFRGHQGMVGLVAWVAGGAELASVGEDHTLRLWTPGAGGRLLGKHASMPRGLSWSAAAGALATCDAGGEVRLWDVAAGMSVLLGRHPVEAIGVAFSPDGAWLASAGAEGAVRVWDVRGRALAFELAGHGGAVLRVAWSPDGARLAATVETGEVWLWDVRARTGAIVARHAQLALDVAFSPDGTRVASSGFDGVVRVVEVASGREQDLIGHQGAVFQLAWSPDGAHLASAGGDMTVRVWDVASGASRVLRVDDGAVMRVQFSPDGRTLASGGRDAAPRLWNDPFSGMPPADQAGLAAWLDARTSVVIGADDRPASPTRPASRPTPAPPR